MEKDGDGRPSSKAPSSSSSSSSSELSDDDGTFDASDWTDLEPMSIKSSSNILKIKYSPKFEQAFGYLRAVMAKDELSERALRLTADCIHLQASNFTVWYFRRRILHKMRHHLQNELKFISDIIKDEPKNYQTWHHRQTIVEWLNNPSEEKEFTSTILDQDSKNYHAWQHRQWVVKSYNLWQDEIDFIDQKIDDDIRNNSAWNHRYFVVEHLGLEMNQDLFIKERDYTLNKIETSCDNESSWSYLRGILRLHSRSLSSDQRTMAYCENKHSTDSTCTYHLTAFLLDAISEKFKENLELKKKALEFCVELKSKDKIRFNYWKYREEEFT